MNTNKGFRTLMFLTAMLVCSASLRTGYALMFTDSVNFATNQAPSTLVSYGTNQSSGFSWQHDIRDNLNGNSIGSISILDAVLSVTYSSTNLSESWTLDGFGDLLSTFNNAVTNFALGKIKLDDLQTDGLLNVPVIESTSGADSFRIFNATLSGNYSVKENRVATTVPEPSEFFLVVAGLGMLRLIKMRKQELIRL